MELDNYITIGNATTILNTVFVIIAGYVIGFLISIGINLPITDVQLASIFTAICFAVFGYVNAKYHNNFWDKEEDTLNIPLADLTDAQVKAIQNFINYQTTKNNNEIADLDPASEYDGGC